MKNGKLKNDIILIACLVVAGIVLAVVLLLLQKNGAQVQVRVSGEIVQTFSLNSDTEYEIIGKDGGRNFLVVQDGQAWIEEADCPDKLCKNMGKIKNSGQSVICLPHEVVVEIISEENAEQDVDIIVE